MKLSASNIGWLMEQDREVYKIMQKYGYIGLEIAPTRIFSKRPYDRLEDVKNWRSSIAAEYGFVIPSIQSIWHGRSEKLFGTKEERNALLNYTRKAIDFATEMQCENLVFGCPVNRNIPEGTDPNTAINFFKITGDYAVKQGTVIGMEANPTIYHTNYINDTLSAIDLIEQVNSKGFLLNLDVGTMIQNQEEISELVGKVHLINHVHISEPGLKPIRRRALHQELMKLLRQEEYDGFVSVEMEKVSELTVLEACLKYVRDVFI